LFERLQHRIAVTADPVLISLLAELKCLPAPVGAQEDDLQGEHAGFAVTLKFRSRSGVLSFISTTTVRRGS
jgi:hypothetical protein